MALNIGIMLVYGFGSTLNWAWLAMVAAVPPTLMVILMYFMPETPRWLLTKGQTKQAAQALTWLRGPHMEKEVIDLLTHFL